MSSFHTSQAIAIDSMVTKIDQSKNGIRRAQAIVPQATSKQDLCISMAKNNTKPFTGR